MQSEDTPSPYDQIMRLLHDAHAFAAVENQPRIAIAARHVRQVADTEFRYQAACHAHVQRF